MENPMDLEAPVLLRRLIQWIVEFTPGQRIGRDAFLGDIGSMCDEGKVLFVSFCENLKSQHLFLGHISVTDDYDGCPVCQRAFVSHISLVTD